MKSLTVPFYISHQGCPHTCIFCDQRLISGSSGNLPDPVEILERVKLWEETARGREIEVAFFGGTFTSLEMSVQERLLAPLQPLLASGRVRGVRLSTRPDAIDANRVRWLAARGVTTIEIGVQSMDDGVLAAAGRGHDAAASETALRVVAGAGLTAVAQLMPGLPGDTPSLSLAALKRVIAAGAGSVRLYPAVVFRGTRLAELFGAGEYRPPDPETMIATCKMLVLEARKASVPVLRIGLQSDGNGFDRSIIAGFWHPALGHLVYSAMFLDLLLEVISGLRKPDRIRLRCHPKRVSDVAGHRRRNLAILEERGVVLEKIISDAGLSMDELVISHWGTETRGSILDLAYDPAELPAGESNA